MIDRQWQARSSCNMLVVGAGNAAASGLYCEVGEFDGHRMWVKLNTTGFANAIFYSGVKWVIQVGGLVLYETTEESISPDGPVPTNWSTATLGVDPAPTTGVNDGWETLECAIPAKYSEDEDRSNGLIELRRKLTVDIVFTGADYDRFWRMESDPDQRCKEILIRRRWRCMGQWKTVWTGVFSTGAGEWNFDDCEFTVRPDTMDKYTCLMRAMNRKFNVLQAPPVEAQAVVVPSLQFGVCIPGLPVECPDILDVDGTTPINEWEFAHSQVVTLTCPDDPGVYTPNIYWRERETTICVGGSPVPPVGAGWVLLTNNCATDGTAVYVRNSTIPWTFGDATAVFSESPDPIPPDSSCAWTYLGTVDINANVNPFCTGYDHYFICLASGDAVVFDRARTLQSVANLLIEKAGCGFSGMVSDLLEWNAPGDAPGYAPGINYVNGRANQHGALVLVRISDALDPGASNPATIGEMTLKDLFTLLSVSMRLFWRIDDQNRIRIEHWTYWTAPIGLELASYPNEKKSEPLQYAHLKTEIQRYERPLWAQSQGIDFRGVDIEYSGPCVASESESDVREYPVGDFMSDIAFIIADPDEISIRGFVLLATAYSGSVYNTIIDRGALSTNFVINAPMSWANLERDFWMWDRLLPTGTMNNEPVEFEGFLPNIEQRNVVLSACCDYTAFDSTRRVATALGYRLGGLNAFVKRAEYDESAETLTLTLRYAY